MERGWPRAASSGTHSFQLPQRGCLPLSSGPVVAGDSTNTLVLYKSSAFCPGNRKPKLRFLLSLESFKPTELSFSAAPNTLTSSYWNHHHCVAEEVTAYNYSFSFYLFLFLPDTTSFIFWLTQLCSLMITSQITVIGSFSNQLWHWRNLRLPWCTTVTSTSWACWLCTQIQPSSKQVIPALKMRLKQFSVFKKFDFLNNI